jgi:hypothetical protein
MVPTVVASYPDVLVLCPVVSCMTLVLTRASNQLGTTAQPKIVLSNEFVRLKSINRLTPMQHTQYLWEHLQYVALVLQCFDD